MPFHFPSLKKQRLNSRLCERCGVRRISLSYRPVYYRGWCEGGGVRGFELTTVKLMSEYWVTQLSHDSKFTDVKIFEELPSYSTFKRVKFSLIDWSAPGLFLSLPFVDVDVLDTGGCCYKRTRYYKTENPLLIAIYDTSMSGYMSNFSTVKSSSLLILNVCWEIIRLQILGTHQLSILSN